MRGYLQIYTGNGKGKTTAALGLALRAAAAGKRVFMGQFVKGMHYSELDLVPRIPGFTVTQYGRGCFIEKQPESTDIEAARRGLSEMAGILADGDHDLVIMDEICIALHFGLVDLTDVVQAIERRAPHVEAVLTGRYAPPELIDLADLVTEMREIKHYYQQGVEARTGIET